MGLRQFIRWLFGCDKECPMVYKQIIAVPGGSNINPNLVVDDNDAGAGAYNIVAFGLLDMTAGAWIGSHPGFEAAVTDNGPGDFTVHLSSDGAATMAARVTPLGIERMAGMNGPLGGAGLRDCRVGCATPSGAVSNPVGWGGGSVLGAMVPTDDTVFIEIIDTA